VAEDVEAVLVHRVEDELRHLRRRELAAAGANANASDGLRELLRI
jgi:hypothetical protein